LNYHSADAPAVRLVDQLLDMLLVATLLGAPLIFYTRGYDVFEFNKISVMRVLTTAAAGLMLWKLLFVRPMTLVRSALDVPVLAWLAVCVVATFHTVNWRLSVHGVYEDFEGITTWFMYVFLFWWPLQHVRTERQIRLALGAVVLAGTVAGFYGLLQNFGIDFVPWNPDTYNPERMFSTMGNPNFLAAYTVMSMPITFIFFIDLPSKIRTDKAFCTVLLVASVFASAFLIYLFNVDYLNFDPQTFGAQSDLGMLLSLKFWVTKILMAFPVICAALLYFGRLRWILFLSMAGQLASTFFTKSRGGVFAMAAIIVLFLAAFVFEVFGAAALTSLATVAGVLASLGVVVWFFYSGAWEGALRFSYENHPWLALFLFLAVLAGIRWVVKRKGREDLLGRNLDYVLGLLIMVWALLFVPAVRQTTYEMLERFSKLFHPSEVRVTPRLFIWKAALKMLHDRPFFGFGLDTFQISFPPYREALYWILEWNGTPEKAHNFVMQTAATMGFAGLLAFAWMHVAWTAQSFRDWRRQGDESRRLILLGCYAAWLGFFIQNLFSFTVVGYGSLWWVLWGLLAAMQHTWERSDKALAAAAAPAAATSGAGAPLPSASALSPAPAPEKVPAWGGAAGAWIGGVAFLGLALLACAAGGFNFFDDLASNAVGLAVAAAGLGCLIWILWRGPEVERPGTAAWVLVAAAAFGVFAYSAYSLRIWVADSFYKQGQVGMNAGQPKYAAIMYEKAAGQIKAPLSDRQMANIHEAAIPPQQERIGVLPGLNQDQELYWVKMGIAFETAAAQETDPNTKLDYYRTALAIHHLTLEMNPINGYNFNNKGRVLRSMGDAFGRSEFYEKALDHYDKAIALDVNNVYFSLDRMNTLLSLRRVEEAMNMALDLTRKFPDFAVPYSYAGYIYMNTGHDDQAEQYLGLALKADWKGDAASKALACVNLGQVLERTKRVAEAEQSYRAGYQANPGLPEAYLHDAQALDRLKRRPEAVAVLRALLQAIPNQPDALALLKKFGVQP
jgi:tetratricopeptide (TPR) repeat protein